MPAPSRPTPRSTSTPRSRRALDALPPDFRAAVVLCDLEELSYEEIAATLGREGRHRPLPHPSRPGAAARGAGPPRPGLRSADPVTSRAHEPLASSTSPTRPSRRSPTVSSAPARAAGPSDTSPNAPSARTRWPSSGPRSGPCGPPRRRRCPSACSIGCAICRRPPRCRPATSRSPLTARQFSPPTALGGERPPVCSPALCRCRPRPAVGASRSCSSRRPWPW